MTNEPKKRGRPPGSKNGVKITPPSNLAAAVKQKIAEQKTNTNPAPIVPSVVLNKTEEKKTKESNQKTEEIKDTSQYKNYRLYSPGERVKHVNTGEYGYVKLHRPGERYVYINWGGDYMYWLAVDLLELAEIKPKYKKQ